MLSSAVVDVIPSSVLISAAVAVTPSNMFISEAVDVIPKLERFTPSVVLIAATSASSNNVLAALVRSNVAALPAPVN